MAKPRDPNQRPPQDPAVQVFALGAAFDDAGVKTVPLDDKPDAAPFFQLLNQQNQAATANGGDVSFGLTDALRAVGSSFSTGPNYERPKSIHNRIVGPNFDDAATQQTVGSTLAGRFTVPTVRNLQFSDPVEGAERISSGFGMRKHPITGEYTMHHGVDLAAPIGRNVNAAAAGVVVFSGKVGGYGNTVIMLHHDEQNGYFYTLYAHNQNNRVSSGQTVEAGHHIAELGNTGRSTAPHLHFEAGRIRPNGEVIVVDPVAVLKNDLTAERIANMEGKNAGSYVAGLFRNMDIQVAQASPAPAPN